MNIFDILIYIENSKTNYKNIMNHLKFFSNSNKIIRNKMTNFGNKLRIRVKIGVDKEKTLHSKIITDYCDVVSITHIIIIF